MYIMYVIMYVYNVCVCIYIYIYISIHTYLAGRAPRCREGAAAERRGDPGAGHGGARCQPIVCSGYGL